MEQLYNGINGEEFKKALIRDVSRILDDDSRFRRAIAYHRLQWKVAISFKAFGPPPQEVTIEGEATAKPLQQEVNELRQQLAHAESDAEGISKQRETYRLERDRFQSELDEVRKELGSAHEHIRQLTAAKSAVVTEHPWVGPQPEEATTAESAVEFTVEHVQPQIEEPDRLRAELQSQDADLVNVTVGRSAAEARTIDTDGKPVPVQVAARSAIVGRGQRPSNVVGRQRE